MAENKVDVGGWINEAFELYKANFGLLCVATLVAGLLIAPLVMFAMPLIVDQKQEFWPAIQASLEKAKEEYVSLLVVTLLGSLISALGLLLCGVGVILTAPFGAILSVVAYRHLFEGVTTEPVPVIDVPVMDVPPAEPTQA